MWLIDVEKCNKKLKKYNNSFISIAVDKNEIISLSQQFWQIYFREIVDIDFVLKHE